MRHAFFFFSLKSGEWEEYKNTFRNEVKVTAWAFDRIKEAFEKVAKDEARTLSTVQEIITRSTDCLRASRGQGGVTMSYLSPHCNSFPMEDHVLWVSGRKNIRIGGVRSAESSMTGSDRTGSRWCKPAKVEVAGEPTRRWRRPHTEHRDEPLWEGAGRVSRRG